jgi:hypothetical protein
MVRARDLLRLVRPSVFQSEVFFSAGTTLRPEWGQLVGVELYSHAPGNSSTSCDAHVNACFDGTENKNLVKVRCMYDVYIESP